MLGNEDGFFDPDNIKVVGLKVAIRKEEAHTEIEQHGILIPESSVRGFKGNSGTIIAIGDDATEQTGLSIGARVKFDQCGIFYDTHPVVILNCENIIVRLDDNDNHVPLKNMVFAKTIGSWCEFIQSDIIFADNTTDMAVGEIIAVDNCDVVEIGDRVILTTDGDAINSADGRYYIYKNDQLFVSF